MCKKIIIAPVFNEELFIGRILRFLEDRSDFIIVIDDGSTDMSWGRIVHFAEGKNKIIHYRFKRNRGKARVIKLGLEIVQFMLERGYIGENDLIFTIDTDGQHYLQDMEKLEAVINRGYEIVLARRSFANYPGLRKMGNYFLSLYASILGGFRYHDSESGFRCMKTCVVRPILAYYTGARYSDSQEIAIIAAKSGFKISNSYISETIYFRPGGAVYAEGFLIIMMGLLVFLKMTLRITRKDYFLDSVVQELVLSQLKKNSAQSTAMGGDMDANIVMLIYPPGPKYIREDRCPVPLKGMVAASLRDPVDLASIASSLGPGFKCFLRDYPAEGAGDVRFIKDLYSIGPSFIIVQFIYPTFYNDIDVCKLAKKILPGVKIIGKGPCFLRQADSILKQYDCLDVAVVGEAEQAVREVISGRPLNEIDGIVFRKNGEIFSNKKRGFVRDLDVLSLPDRSLIKNELYRRPDNGELQTVIHAQRGCSHSCIFCQTGVVSGREPRYRSIGSMIKEIEECVSKYKINNFFFKADSLTLDKSWVVNLCLEIIARRLKISWISNSRVDDLDEGLVVTMKDAGCRGLALGIESGSQSTLDRANKEIKKEDMIKAVYLCKKHKLQVLAMFIVGWPWEDKRSIDETIHFAIKLNTTLAEFNLLTVFPGTPLFEEFYKQGLIRDERDVYVRDYSTKGRGTAHLTAGQLMWLRRKAYLTYYFRLRYFKENILQEFRSLKDFLRFFKYGIQKIYSLF